MTLLRYALRSLARGGQRALLAAACVAFGILALVSMSVLSESIARATLRPTDRQIGGDLLAAPPAALDALGGRARGQLAAWQDSGWVAQADIRQQPGGLVVLRAPDSGRGFPLFAALAVDPQTYPLVGSAAVVAPAGSALADVIQPGSAVLTRDVADEAGVWVGDTVRIGGAQAGAARIPVGAVVASLAGGQGRALLLHRSDAGLIGGVGGARPQVAMRLARRDTASVRAMAQRVEAAGWTVTQRVGQPPGSSQEEALDTALRGAGLLGLLLGGVGVAGALRVLLAARRRELATLRAVGYRRGHLVGLIAAEMVVLGLAGSAAGVAAGLAVAAGLMRLFGRLAAQQLALPPIGGIVLTGLVAGVATTLLFGTYAVLRASAVRPADLFRDAPDLATRAGQARAGGLWVAILALFGLLASVVLGSAVQGLGVVAVGLVGLGVVGGLLVGAVRGVAALPLPGNFLARLARTNLARQPGRTLTAGVALFAGALAIGLALAVVSGVRGELSGRFDPSETVPVRVLAGQTPADTLLARLNASGSPLRRVSVESAAQAPIRGAASGEVVTGREVAARYAPRGTPDSVRYAGHELETGRWPGPGEAALGVGADHLGDSVVVGAGPSAQVLVVVGTFGPADLMAGLPAALVHASDHARLLPDAVHTAVGEVERGEHDAAVVAVGRAVPQGLALSRLDVERLINGALVRLFWFVVGVSALAALAGAILIANAVGLALVERRRELGMLQAIGYRRRHLLGVLAAEYGLVGLVAGVAGAGAAALALLVLSRITEGSGVSMTWPQALLLVAVTTALAAGCALVTAAPTVRGRPLRLLRAAE